MTETCADSGDGISFRQDSENPNLWTGPKPKPVKLSPEYVEICKYLNAPIAVKLLIELGVPVQRAFEIAGTPKRVMERLKEGTIFIRKK